MLLVIGFWVCFLDVLLGLYRTCTQLPTWVWCKLDMLGPQRESRSCLCKTTRIFFLLINNNSIVINSKGLFFLFVGYSITHQIISEVWRIKHLAKPDLDHCLNENTILTRHC
jgi:hypothetical protein